MILASQKNLKELEVWREFFEKGLNQKGFHELFRAVKKIGKGSFATVYLVKKMENDKYYAVKSFSKEVLYAEKKGKESLIN